MPCHLSIHILSIEPDPLLFLLTEVSSQFWWRRRPKVHPEPIIHDVYYYRDGNNEFHRITGPVQAGTDHMGHMFGVVIDGVLRPIYTRYRQMIMVDLRNKITLSLTREIAMQIGFGQRPQFIIQVTIVNS